MIVEPLLDNKFKKFKVVVPFNLHKYDLTIVRCKMIKFGRVFGRITIVDT